MKPLYVGIVAVIAGILVAAGIAIWGRPVNWTPRQISSSLGACLCTSHDQIQRDRCLCDAWKRCDSIGQPRSCAMDQITTGAVDICGALTGPVACP